MALSSTKENGPGDDDDSHTNVRISGDPFHAARSQAYTIDGGDGTSVSLLVNSKKIQIATPDRSDGYHSVGSAGGTWNHLEMSIKGTASATLSDGRVITATKTSKWYTYTDTISWGSIYTLGLSDFDTTVTDWIPMSGGTLY